MGGQHGADLLSQQEATNSNTGRTPVIDRLQRRQGENVDPDSCKPSRHSMGAHGQAVANVSNHEEGLKGRRLVLGELQSQEMDIDEKRP